MFSKNNIIVPNVKTRCAAPVYLLPNPTHVTKTSDHVLPVNLLLLMMIRKLLFEVPENLYCTTFQSRKNFEMTE